jgi:voltage-gated potassium channel Kch
MIAFATILKNLASAVRRGFADARFRALAYLAGVALATGTVFYWRFEDWGLVESFYFSVITLTTVGYGDLAPTTTGTRLFTVFYVLFGLGVLVALLSAVAGHAAEARMERKAGNADEA